ncbi:hypothetical protein H6G81_14430 [Scytonema hofmannii FACHB-248]|uniref:Uncharacterized protein n=1 Tax=Scytonema hofmannii FACHB-248 TaxID=1842502 RepID=A0ABR8GRM7_9CYAN|nr:MULTISPECIES: hypothetical protein [Nostocales]MBD2605690.1 hypothetical protein [Scytonema hofmannii FACHB-248]
MCVRESRDAINRVCTKVGDRSLFYSQRFSLVGSVRSLFMLKVNQLLWATTDES